MRLAIITARGGSKRIPKKNIREFHGKPIIAYSIAAALESNCFDEVVVSTDDSEIAGISIKYGAKIPFMRSEKNSDDFSTTSDVLHEVISEYLKLSKRIQYVCCLYPTAPFIKANDLMKAFDMLMSDEYVDLVMPVVKFSFPIQRAFRIRENRLEYFNPENAAARSQDLEPAYHDAGQFYFFRVEPFMAKKSLMLNNVKGIILPELKAQDIDSPEDWTLAEIKFKLNQVSNAGVLIDAYHTKRGGS
ncbi:MAG: pseudaminic acid cytidylyltransferase [Gammaproteobacteria bacterium RIFCSPHIGHO2_12_FULL_38_14]|nr:MAG: pseudaminic acid cytidylyltransferase [Gammaproteobacteria bacterium RIFCSPHIGHO2_12_FULL_38_14]